MKKLQRQPAVQTLFYRLYVLYLEGQASALKSVNKLAFYRISIWNGSEKIGEMLEGTCPVVLAKKVFLGNASLTFSQTTKNTKPKVILWYYFKGEETVVGEAVLDLTQINEKFLNDEQKYCDKQTLTFSKGQKEQELTLTFNIFVDRGKIELDSYVRKFKQEEKQNNRQKRIDLGRQKMSTVGEALKRTQTLKHIESPTSSLLSPKMITAHSADQPLNRLLSMESDKPLRKLEQLVRNVNKLNQKTSLVHIQVEQEQKSQSGSIKQVQSEFKQFSGVYEKSSPRQGSSKQNKPVPEVNKESATPPKISKIFNMVSSESYNQELQINSELRFNNINKMKAVLQKIEGMKQPSVSSQVTSYNRQFNQNKTYSMAVGTISLISDGSQASEMIANNATQTYSQRAVVKFKERTRKCINVAIILFVIIVVYFLFVPTAKFSKIDRSSRIRSKSKKYSIKDTILQF